MVTIMHLEWISMSLHSLTFFVDEFDTALELNYSSCARAIRIHSCFINPLVLCLGKVVLVYESSFATLLL